jgi:hypothetical protein
MTWHYLDDSSEHCTFSPGREVEFLPTSCSDTCPSALLRLMPTAARYCSPGKETDTCHTSPSGTTCKPLTGGHGKDKLTLSPADSLAKTSVVPEKVPELRVPDRGFGARWRESSMKYDRATFSWKTHRCLFAEALQQSSVTLPRWGMMRDGVVYRRRMSERPIKGIGSGWLPTPTANPYGTNQGGSQGRVGPVRMSLATMARRNAWPTPQARDWRGAPGKGCQQRGGHQSSLPKAVGGGLLNPPWVEWLMGWPIGWTALEPLATDRSRQWLRSHGIF